MPPRKRKSSRALTKAQRKEVNRLVDKAIDEEIEDKSQTYLNENLELYHNLIYPIGNFLADIQQGINTGDGPNTKKTVRIGDQIRFKNINMRFWLSNKWDRPNVMYKGVLFWYPVGATLNNQLIYLTQQNKMLDRYNYKQIKVIDTFMFNSTTNYSYAEVGKKEHSYTATLNKSYKNKKIQYDSNSTVTKGWELGVSIVAYDAYGTLQEDNIASFAINSNITFQDA